MAKKKVKVMHLVTDMGIGGVESFVYNLIEQCDRDSFEMFVVTLFPAEKSKLEEKLDKMGIPVIHIGMKKKYNTLKTMLRLLSLVKKEKPDIVNFHTYVIQMGLFIMLFYRKCKYVHTVHIPAETELKACSKWIAKLEYEKLGMIPVAVSQFVKKTMMELYLIKECQVIYNGIDLNRFKKQSKMQENDMRIKFITIARFVPEKNHEMIIRAFKRVCVQYDEICLKLAGNGKLIDSMKQLVIELDIKDKVEFLGNRDDIPELLNDCDIFLLGSEFEGFGLSILEAMACGLPVISTNVGAVSEILKDREEGMLIKVEEKDMVKAMITLIRDKELREKYGKRGCMRAQKFSLDQTVRQYEELFFKLSESV